MYYDTAECPFSYMCVQPVSQTKTSITYKSPTPTVTQLTVQCPYYEMAVCMGGFITFQIVKLKYNKADI